jgi:propanol-preferring alcohol dehydrogenase
VSAHRPPTALLPWLQQSAVHAFTPLQRELNRFFDDLGEGLDVFSSLRMASSMDVLESRKGLEITLHGAKITASMANEVLTILAPRRADIVLARADYCFPVPEVFSDVEAAPLLCAGLIGYRAWTKACARRPVERLGLYGFGAAAHLLAQLALWSGQAVYAFTRPGDRAAQALASGLGCHWVGGSDEAPPERLDAAIVFAPVGALVPAALRAVDKGGVVVCGGIHMTDIPAFPYEILWEERCLMSVANLTRQDGRDYLPLAARAGVRPHVVAYPLRMANRALDDLRDGAISGAAVLLPESPAPSG